MASQDMERTVNRKDKRISDYEGSLTSLLQDLLRSLDCHPDIPVKIYTYYREGRFDKYHVGLLLPTKLGLSAVMPAGEARNQNVAYRMAVVEAITRITAFKKMKLIGTKF